MSGLNYSEEMIVISDSGGNAPPGVNASDPKQGDFFRFAGRRVALQRTGAFAVSVSEKVTYPHRLHARSI
jgi:hypothetical protein